MTNAADYAFSRGGRTIDLLGGLLRWAAPRLAVYLGVVVASAFLFMAGATIYAFVWPAPAVSPSQIIPAEIPDNPLIRPAAPPTQMVPAEDLIADNAVPSVGASSVFGMRIYGPNNERVGQVTEIILGRQGNAQAIVIGLDGSYWWNKKYVVIPFNSVSLVSEPQTAYQTIAVKAEHGVVPYSLSYLQKLPMGSHPLLPRHN